jgi:hypothetical protein
MSPFDRVMVGLGVVQTSCEGGGVDCMSWIAVGLQGTTFADLVQTGSTGTSPGMGLPRGTGAGSSGVVQSRCAAESSTSLAQPDCLDSWVVMLDAV